VPAGGVVDAAPEAGRASCFIALIRFARWMVS
jgi:hypothetical protein